MKQLVRLVCLSVVLMLSAMSMAFAKGDTLTIGIAASAKTLDPMATADAMTHNIMNQMYETLVTFDDNENIVPLLAEKWQVSSDGKTFTFFLKKGVKFHNGEVMTANDVVYTFKRSMGPQGGAVKAFSMYIDPDGIQKIDDYTVSIRTKEPMPSTFLPSLTHVWSGILSEKAVEQYGKDYGVHPVGTGPFKLARFILNDRVIFDRFEDYHGAKAPLLHLIMRTIVEASSRTIELESGAVDMIIDTPTVDIPRLKDNPALKVIIKPGSRVYQLSYEVTKPPYNDLRVRQAMNLAVSRQGIVRVVFQGYADPATGPVTSAIKYNKQATTPVVIPDIAKAKALLAEAGYPNGFKGEIWVPDRTEMMDIGTVLQENFKQIGLNIEVKVIEWGTFLDVIRQKGHQPFVSNWWGGPPALDPFFLLTTAFHSSAAGSTNRSHFSDRTVDELLDKGAILPDGPEREAVYGKLWDRLNELLPWIVVANPYNVAVADKNLEGFVLSSGTVNNFTRAYFKK